MSRSAEMATREAGLIAAAEALAAEGRMVSSTALAKRIGVSQCTAHRIRARLRDRGLWTWPDGEKGYSVDGVHVTAKPREHGPARATAKDRVLAAAEALSAEGVHPTWAAMAERCGVAPSSIALAVATLRTEGRWRWQDGRRSVSREATTPRAKAPRRRLATKPVRPKVVTAKAIRAKTIKTLWRELQREKAKRRPLTLEEWQRIARPYLEPANGGRP